MEKSLPSNVSPDAYKKSYGGVCVSVIVAFIGFLIFESDNGKIIGAATIVLGSFICRLICEFGEAYYYTIKSKCPKCGESFCIEWLKEKIVSESVMSERDEKGRKSYYRVGVKNVTWRCRKCGHIDVGTTDYKDYINDNTLSAIIGAKIAGWIDKHMGYYERNKPSSEFISDDDKNSHK